MIVTADHLNAIHLGKRITITNSRGIIMSGTLKTFKAWQQCAPTYGYVHDDDNNSSNVRVLRYQTRTGVVMHLSNQLNSDIKATVDGTTELLIEEDE